MTSRNWPATSPPTLGSTVAAPRLRGCRPGEHSVIRAGASWKPGQYRLKCEISRYQYHADNQEYTWKPNAKTNLPPAWKTTRSASRHFGGTFDYDAKAERLHVVNAELESAEVWNDPKHAQELGRAKKSLEKVVQTLSRIGNGLHDAQELFELAADDDDDATLTAIEHDTDAIGLLLEDLEFRRMFNNPADPLNCFMDIQAGAGGTEAQDWASILLRQYLRYCERKDFKAEILEESDGDVAGIKSATIKIEGEYAFGFLRTETGVHRLVRKSPFDSANGRHTSFASVFVYPEVDDSVERITHMPTGIVVQCQNDRSQHRNRAEAMQMLKSRLYELEMRQRMAEQQKMEDAKTDVGWGHQIRSYVLDQSRIKDLRTNVEISNTQKVLDGDLDPFIIASLKQGV